jgi:HAE1 family hydrophobic/amphiphilic exporter-1
MKISDISMKRPIYVIVLFLVIAILGALGFSSMQSELMPKFTPPSMNVQVIYPGASPIEVENSLTRKLEDALSSLQGVESMRSFSFEGMSIVFVSFTYGTDIDKSITDAQNKISSKKAELPSSILTPIINKITIDDKSIITLSATSNLESTKFSDLIEHRVIPELLRIPGMAKVLSIGEKNKEIQVNLDMDKLRALGISPIQIQGILRSANLDFPTGSVRNDQTNTSIRLSGKLESVEQIRNLVIITLPSGTQIRMRDIADVVEAPKDVVKIARVNGKEAVLLNIFKQGDANSIELSDNVKEAIQGLEKTYSGDGLKMEFVSDSSVFTRDSIKSVLADLMMAILLVTLVILVFLHNWRNALIVMLVVPLSLIGSFIGMKLFHFSLNLMSLLGLSVVIGVLVDDAIVVIENVYRHMEMGKSAFKATTDAMNEIGYTVITVTIVLVIVFLPIAFTNSLVSDILRQFCGVIVFAILFSLLAALTLVPLLTSRFGKIDTL